LLKLEKNTDSDKGRYKE